MDRFHSLVVLAISAAALVTAAPSANALSFGTSASANVSGNCRAQTTSQNTGGNFIDATQAAATGTGAITGSCASSYQPGPWLGNASAAAALSTGQLRVSASGSGSEAVGNLYPNAALVNLDVRSSAQFFDTFRLVAPVGYSGPNPIIDIILTMSYNLELGAGSDQSNVATLNWFLQTSSATVTNLRTNRCDEMGIVSNPTTCFLYGYPGGSMIRHRIAVPVATPEVSIFAQLDARVYNDATADASATGTLSLVLPEGFSIASDSTVLLIPEATTDILLVAAASLVAVIRRARAPGA